MNTSMIKWMLLVGIVAFLAYKTIDGWKHIDQRSNYEIKKGVILK